MKYRHAFFLSLFLLSSLATAESLDGPRIGVTYLDHKTQSYLKNEKQVELTSSSIIQFGWQYETRFFSIPEGPQGIVEFVPLVGGFEQGLAIPSATALAGLRFNNGVEVLVGPNVSPSSTGVALAIGHTSQMGGLNLPINLAYVSTPNGGRISVLIGFNAQSKYKNNP